MRYIFILFVALFFASCYTKQKAINHSVKAYSYFQNEVAKLHSDWFPITTKTIISTEYLQGEDSIIIDTVVVDCDSVKDSLIKVVKVPYEKHHFRVDTFIQNQIDTIESTAKLRAIQEEVAQYRIENEQLKYSIDKKNNRLAFFISFSALCVIGFLFLIFNRLKAFLK